MKTVHKKRRFKTLPTSCLTISLMLWLNLAAWSQTSTVVIAEVMYDHPRYDNETTRTAHTGEFLSLYNYEEEEVDISGWRIEITDLLAASQPKYTYTVPANTVLWESGIAVIASRPRGSTFDILQFYGAEMPEETDGYLLLYTFSLAFPDTRSRIRVYDAQNRLQDELVYDGNSNALSNEPLLRATNPVNRNYPLSQTVSIQREKIIIKEGNRIISRSDYFTADSLKVVQLFNYTPEEYSYTAPPSILTAGLPEDLSLSGTETKDKDYRTKNITSTQVIASGKTQYWAEEGIVLGPGFEVKAGTEFVAGVAPDSVHLNKMMTYNLKGKSDHYSKHAQIIKNASPDVVSVQEVRGIHKFNILKDESGYKGKRCFTIVDYGIGLLWNQETVGNPIEIVKRKVATYDFWYEIYRAFIVAEFRDFCFVATHFSLEESGRKKMANRILDNTLVKKCKRNGKPIYIAGDMNEDPRNKEKAIPIFEANGFIVLNNTTDSNHSTRPEGGISI